MQESEIEYYWTPQALTNRDAKILNETLASQNQKHIKQLYSMTTWHLSQEFRVGLTYENQSK